MSKVCGECDYWVPGHAAGECHYWPITATGWPAVGKGSKGCHFWSQDMAVYEYQFERLDPEALEASAHDMPYRPYQLVEHPPR